MDAVLPGPVSRTRMSEQVVSVLRDAILQGVLGPGTSLREVALAEKFDVSRNTVREAIRTLVTEGLVQHHMHRGAVVARPTEDDVVDVYRARAAVELAAVEALPQARPEQLRDLDAALRLMEDALDREDNDATTEADLAFHRSLVAITGSPRLEQFYAHLQGELRLLLLVADRDTPEAGKLAEHRRMLDLAAAGDVAGLRAAMTAHVRYGEAALLRVLRERERGADEDAVRPRLSS